MGTIGPDKVSVLSFSSRRPRRCRPYLSFQLQNVNLGRLTQDPNPRPLVGLTILGQPIEYMKLQASYRRIEDDPPYLSFQLQNQVGRSLRERLSSFLYAQSLS